MPFKLLVMGVSGCGKSTVAAGLAGALGVALIEGDDHHLPQSQDKMRRGIALTDADREPWLDQLGVLLADAQGGVVLTCSALRRRYRDRLRAAEPALQIVFIEISPEEARARVAARASHFFPASLVANQFDALESPLGEPGVLPVDATWTIEAQCDAVLRWLAPAPSHS
ncbi:Thermoresistant gluconokinase [Variovorax sp. SRS16]|uniref:gluconokinase n=1 Tax=Variovorax sp. SRS16 TaxID=282217 RepID=UPI0013173B6C|nr:gluconokinase, GntK/IdnK-type [Variovorax sp. SRS16]VTU23694.1 Thermoresistant gluconokinase [Variovorax sp. SRS16]